MTRETMLHIKSKFISLTFHSKLGQTEALKPMGGNAAGPRPGGRRRGRAGRASAWRRSADSGFMKTVVHEKW